MKAHGEVEAQPHTLLTPALNGSSHLHALAALAPGKMNTVLVGQEPG
jgi:hypothetical protein